MKYSLYTLLFLTFLMVSCGNKKNESTESLTDDKYYNAKDELTKFDSLPMVKVAFKDSIVNWKGYHRVKETLEKLKTTTPNEALVAAEDLLKNVELMRDSIQPNSLKVKGIKARINALYNQSLRLKEMKEIPAIRVSEIKKQVHGVFDIFRMVQQKVNAIYEQDVFEKELIEDDFFFSKLDSIR